MLAAHYAEIRTLHVTCAALSGTLFTFRGLLRIKRAMFYAACTTACPMLIAAMQLYESHLDESSRAQLRVLLVSFDAARDTPQQLDPRQRRPHRCQYHEADR
jgi:SCO1/SenC